MTDKDIVFGGWYEFSHVGLQVVRSPTWEEYQTAWDLWEDIHITSAWVLGDLLAYGNRKWGETYAQVAARTRYTVSYLRNIQYVCSNVPTENRHAGLSFSHHQAVAKLKNPEMQEAWLNHAFDFELSRDELRKMASDDEPPPDKLIQDKVNEDPIVIDPPENLREVVADYVAAVNRGDLKTSELLFSRMWALVQDLL